MSNIEHWNLWKLFKNKADSAEFHVAVKKVCETGINLSKTIILTFPNFTLHDETHIHNVCDWMYKLLSEDEREALTANETAMLLMSACCHDVGMSVTDEQKKELLSDFSTDNWKEYFNNFPQDYSKRNKEKEQDRIIRNYVRVNHHARIDENLSEEDWSDDLEHEGIYLENLIDLCKSHGENLKELTEVDICDCDIKLCAVLLRLADILDFDSSRVPDKLFKQLGLDTPENSEKRKSSEEWYKNRAGRFYIRNGELKFDAKFSNSQLEHQLRDYNKWVKAELEGCREYLCHTDSQNRIDIPYLKEGNISRNPKYTCGDFSLTMDQDKILTLLTGKNLYSDSGVFVRELLQNAIDAVMTRCTLDGNFKMTDGKISIRTWTDNEGYSWFRIKDNGIGMDEEIINKYLLKIGRSYYTSDEFNRIQTECCEKGKKINKPISRFGIGILSCFMNDYNTPVEISSKRFILQKDCPAVRMNITGLHGYYDLYNFPQKFSSPMHSPDSKDTGYRTEYGTTICVRVDLYKMVKYRSFKEIVEKYVQFPEIKVEYLGEDGKKEFPTQDELMKLVHKLNPDGTGAEPKVYKHPIPDKKFEELKEKCPWATFTEKPIINFRYFPFDWLSGGKNIQGVSVEVNTASSFKSDDSEYPYPCLYAIKLSNTIGLNAEISERRGRKGKYESISIEYQDLLETNDSENELWEYVLKYLDGGIIAYNGILADTQSITDKNILLLNGEYLPEVDIARDKIIGLPTKAAFALEKIDRELYFLGLTNEFVLKNDLLLTEKELFELLEQNPEWKKDMTFRNNLFEKYTLFQLKEMVTSEKYTNIGLYDEKSLFDNVLLAVLKKHFTVYYKNYGLCIKKKEKDETDTSEFPVQLFFSFNDDLSKFARVGYRTNCYNKNYSFSQWLIKNQKELIEKVPAIYHGMIDNMIFGDDKNKILKFLNEKLEQLQTYRGNCFGVDKSLFLKPEDFV